MSSAAPRQWETAIEAMRQCVGAEHVQTSPDACATVEAATYRTAERVSAIVRPQSREEVVQCVRSANTYKVPLYPVSGGKNWGYGSRVPTRDGCVLIDLKRMNRIVELDEELAYVVVEPGVTQAQLYEFLLERTAGRLWIDATASTLDGSIIGNLLERGHGGTMYCDHVACSANYEVVLPSGDVIHTGYGAFGNASAAHADAWGIGPSLIGLFSQSSFGIVTRATVWLMRAPPSSAVAFFVIGDDRAFSDVVDGMRGLRLDRILKSGPFFGNVYQALPKVARYPWDVMEGQTPLPLDIAVELAKQHRYGLWNGSIGLCGTEAEVAQQKDALAAVLDGKTSFFEIVGRDMRGIDEHFPPSRQAEARAVVAGFTGRVGQVGLAGAYWRMKDVPSDTRDRDLDRDRCGFRFMTATTPFRGRDALEVVSVASRVLLRHGFEPSIGIFPVRERALQYHIASAYDRADEAADRACDESHGVLAEALATLGHYPTRLGIGSMHTMQRYEPTYLRLLSSLRSAIDPSGIMAPLRYASPSGEEG